MSNSHYQAFHAPAARFPGERVRLSGSFGRAIGGVIALLYAWQDRAIQRAQLAATEDRLLNDMGISRAQAEREAAKPFWRP